MQGYTFSEYAKIARMAFLTILYLQGMALTMASF
jgi:hypothetical protein